MIGNLSRYILSVFPVVSTFVRELLYILPCIFVYGDMLPHQQSCSFRHIARLFSHHWKTPRPPSTKHSRRTLTNCYTISQPFYNRSFNKYYYLPGDISFPLSPFWNCLSTFGLGPVNTNLYGAVVLYLVSVMLF